MQRRLFIEIPIFIMLIIISPARRAIARGVVEQFFCGHSLLYFYFDLCSAENPCASGTSTEQHDQQAERKENTVTTALYTSNPKAWWH